MTLDEAIEIKEQHLRDNQPYDMEELEAADKLSIEAMKAWSLNRQGMWHRDIKLLPGETKE